MIIFKNKKLSYLIMNRGRKLIDKLLNAIPAGFYGIRSIIIRITGDFLASTFYPEYNMFDNMVSELGVGPGGIFFTLGLIFSGIISIPFYVAIARSLQSDNIKERSRKSGLFLFYVSDITYILVGIFPSIEQNTIIYYTHGILALISWLAALGYLIIFSKLMLKSDKYSALPAYSSSLLIGFVIVAVLTWQPITEWLMTFMFWLWVLIISSYMLYHKL